jgi:hypothetical protein
VKAAWHVQGAGEVAERVRAAALADRHEEARRKDHIIAGLIQRVPEVGTGQGRGGLPGEPSDGPRSAAGDHDGHTKAKTATAGPQRGAQRPERGFWSRLFGGG